jgi:hypothetical protein
MKTINLLTMVFLFFGLTGFQPSDRKEKKLQKEKEMYELLDSGQFRFIASSARSSLGNFNNLGTNYELKFDSLNLKAYLPYYGRAYSVPYGGSEGVKFELNAGEINKDWNKKKKLFTFSADVSDKNDSYSFYLTTGLSGFADLKITFRNRQPISYYGTIEPLEK